MYTPVSPSESGRFRQGGDPPRLYSSSTSRYTLCPSRSQSEMAFRVSSSEVRNFARAFSGGFDYEYSDDEEEEEMRVRRSSSVQHINLLANIRSDEEEGRRHTERVRSAASRSPVQGSLQLPFVHQELFEARRASRESTAAAEPEPPTPVVVVEPEDKEEDPIRRTIRKLLLHIRDLEAEGEPEDSEDIFDPNLDTVMKDVEDTDAGLIDFLAKERGEQEVTEQELRSFRWLDKYFALLESFRGNGRVNRDLLLATVRDGLRDERALLQHPAAFKVFVRTLVLQILHDELALRRWETSYCYRFTTLLKRIMFCAGCFACGTGLSIAVLNYVNPAMVNHAINEFEFHLDT